MNKYDPIFKAAEKYMRVRKNDVHIPISFHYVLKLIEKYPEADADLAAIALILHDIGWYSIDEDDIYKKGFQSENFMQSDVRYIHESEGVRLSSEILGSLGYSEEFINKVGAIIDGHDTRKEAKSLEDKMVRDADKLWRFTLTGVSVACDWFKQVPSKYCNRLESDIIPQFELPESIEMAKKDLIETRKLLLCDVL